MKSAPSFGTLVHISLVLFGKHLDRMIFLAYDFFCQVIINNKYHTAKMIEKYLGVCVCKKWGFYVQNILLENTFLLKEV